MRYTTITITKIERVFEIALAFVLGVLLTLVWLAWANQESESDSHASVPLPACISDSPEGSDPCYSR
jgi:hypothetical protein